MNLRGSLAEFPIQTIVQLVAGPGKTGRLLVRAAAQSASLDFDGGKLVAASCGDDVGEIALGAAFTLVDADFEFLPASEPRAANLSGTLEALLERAVVERDQILSYREVVPRDEVRFAVSARADAKGDITLSSTQWRTLREVDGQHDLPTIAERIGAGRLATLAVLVGLVRAGLIDTVEPAPADTVEPAPAPEPERPFGPAAEAAPAKSAPSAPFAEGPRWDRWETPAQSAASEPAAPATSSWSWEHLAPTAPPSEPPALSWGPDAAAPPWEPATPAPDGDLSAPAVGQTAPSAEDRRSALAGVLGPAEPALPPTWGPLAREYDPRLAALPTLAPPGVPPVPVLEELDAPLVEPADEPKRKGFFGGLFGPRQEAAPAPPRTLGHEAVAAPPRILGQEAAPAPPRTLGVEATSQAGKLAWFANALLDEYASGHYGTERLEDPLPELLMRVDEQADPIDRPLPVADDRIDVDALEEGGPPEREALHYVATLVSQIYRDAERAFGRDRAKRGYKAAQQQVFGADAAALATPELAGRLPKI